MRIYKVCFLQWLPAHLEITGNENTDKLTKEARNINNDNFVNSTLLDANPGANFKLREKIRPAVVCDLGPYCTRETMFKFINICDMIPQFCVNGKPPKGFRVAILTDKFDNDMQKVTPARAPLSFSLLKSLIVSVRVWICCACARRLRGVVDNHWILYPASLTVRCPQRYFHRDQRRM
ncbi:hypothetical protein TNCV_4736021 [Trichonephila clavipes]|nr:hypothetical protein TNCV_4736021 [Trichonephila clavipes]